MILDEYNNTHHRTINMKPVNVKDNTFIDCKKEVNDKDPKFKVCDHVRISKYKNIFAKRYTPNWFEKVFLIKKVKNTISWTYVINDFNGEEHFMKKNCKKLIKKNLGLKRRLKEKEINYILNGKIIIVYLMVGLKKKI